MSRPGRGIGRGREMDAVLRLLEAARGVEHPVPRAVEHDVRRPEMGLAPCRVGGQREWLLRPRAVEVGRSRVSEIQLVERARRLGVRDADEMPCARLVADDRVVVDVPALVLAGRGVVDPLELADRKITRHTEMVSDYSQRNGRRIRRPGA